MKKLLFIALLFCFAGRLQAQEHEVFNQWPALDSVHSILSATYHPAETGDVAPIKARATELAQTAKKLTPASIPQAWRTQEMRRAVKEFQAETLRVKQLVSKKAPDAQIVSKLSVAHDAFHRIMSLTGENHEEMEGGTHQMQHGKPDQMQHGGNKTEHGRNHQ